MADSKAGPWAPRGAPTGVLPVVHPLPAVRPLPAARSLVLQETGNPLVLVHLERVHLPMPTRRPPICHPEHRLEHQRQQGRKRPEQQNPNIEIF
jgi:hypothetical protein